MVAARLSTVVKLYLFSSIKNICSSIRSTKCILLDKAEFNVCSRRDKKDYSDEKKILIVVIFLGYHFKI